MIYLQLEQNNKNKPTDYVLMISQNGSHENPLLSVDYSVNELESSPKPDDTSENKRIRAKSNDIK